MDSALRHRFLAFLTSDLAAAAHNEAIRGYPPEFKRIALRGREAWLAVTDPRFSVPPESRKAAVGWVLNRLGYPEPASSTQPISDYKSGEGNG